MANKQLAVTDATKNVAVNWDEPHRYTPTSRHRRRLLLRLIADLKFDDCLDAGCAQPYLLQEIIRGRGARGFGCDISDQVIARNAERAPEFQFAVVDLERETWPDDQKFDLVICSETLEHIPDWHAAVLNLVRMSRRHLLITVPGGKLRQTERRLGHHRHYQGPELLTALTQAGCEVSVFRRWGFPMQTLYKALINALAPDTLYDAFCSANRGYSRMQKLIAHTLYGLFFINDLFSSGDQLIVLASKPSQTPSA
jgi:SAM-dependent methyltransferase